MLVGNYLMLLIFLFSSVKKITSDKYIENILKLTTEAHRGFTEFVFYVLNQHTIF